MTWENERLLDETGKEVGGISPVGMCSWQCWYGTQSIAVRSNKTAAQATVVAYHEAHLAAKLNEPAD